MYMCIHPLSFEKCDTANTNRIGHMKGKERKAHTTQEPSFSPPYPNSAS